MPWLFDSQGRAIAFSDDRNVYLPDGNFLGELIGKEVWCGRYVGEIFEELRLVRKRFRPLTDRGAPLDQARIEVPERPPNVDSVQLPTEFQDLELE